MTGLGACETKPKDRLNQGGSQAATVMLAGHRTHKSYG